MTTPGPLLTPSERWAYQVASRLAPQLGFDVAELTVRLCVFRWLQSFRGIWPLVDIARRRIVVAAIEQPPTG